jgi:CorA-like Mg2+ transporter protein
MICSDKLLTTAVLILRTPSAWNQSILASDLGPVHRDLSDDREQWKVLACPDYFQFSPVPDFIPRSISALNQPQEAGKPGPKASHQENLNPNLALCRILVDWHICCARDNVLLQQAATPSLIYFLERALGRLLTLTTEDYKRAYNQCSNIELLLEEKHRLLDYCYTRATRWERLKLSESRMLGEVCGMVRSESEAAQKILRASTSQLKSLVQQIDDQLQKTKEFVGLQLDRIAADQQRQLMHNQIELSKVQIAESRKAIQQTATMRKLTILAFVFIPTSTICGFFGMNVKEFDDHPRLWVFFITLILVVTLVLIIATADGLLDLLMRTFAAMPVLPRGGEPDISHTRRGTAIVLFKVVHTPFALICKVALTISRKLKVLASDGRAYRAGYQDPSMLDRNEVREGATTTALYNQKGAILGGRVDRAMENYRRSWRELWNQDERRRSRAAFDWSTPTDPLPAPTY